PLIYSEPLAPARLPVAPPSPLLARLLTCAPIHGPPPFDRKAFIRVSQLGLQLAEDQAGVEGVCVLSSCSRSPLHGWLPAISVGVSSSWHTVPPSYSSSQFIDATPYRRVYLEMIWAGCRCCDSLPGLTAPLCVNRKAVIKL